MDPNECAFPESGGQGSKLKSKIHKTCALVFGTLSTISLGMGCSCQKDVPEETFKSLHGRVYGSITVDDTDALYETLAEIFTQREVEKNFERIRQFHLKKASEKVVIIIDDIEYRSIDVSGASVDAHWIVRGRIKHNRHLHRRSLEYKANYTLSKEEDGWKISDSELIEHADFELTEEERELGQSND